jgi:MFS superfamily sulfate permease-like transporter
MNAAHAHLALNHLPVVGLLIGTLILAWAVLRRADAAARVALAVLVGAAISVGPVLLTGEPAEEIMEHRADVSAQVIEAHEEAAEAAAIGAGILGVLCAGLLVAARRARSLPALPARAVLVGAIVVTALMLRTANLGGRIHHAEIRGGEASARPGLRVVTDAAYLAR